MGKKPEIISLRDAIYLVQLENFTNRFERQIAKDKKETRKWLKIAFIPFGITSLLSIILLSPIPIIVGSTYVGGVSIYKMFKDGEETERKIREKYNLDPKITHLVEDDTDFSFLEKPLLDKKEEDYFSDLFISIKEETSKPNLKLVSKEEQVPTPKPEEIDYDMTKEEVMIELASQYRVYAQAYKLPKFTVTNKEWELLFDTMYSRLKELSLENKLYDIMSFLQRYTFAESLINNRKEININSYLNQLSMLEKIGFSNIDINSIKEEIRSHLKPTRIIDFNKIILSKKQS